MFKKTLLAGLLLTPIAYGQQYPSPTYNNLTVNGTILTPLVPAPWLPLSGGTISKPVVSGTNAFQLNILNPTTSTAPTYLSIQNSLSIFTPNQPAAYFGATGTLNGTFNDPATTAYMTLLAGGIDGSGQMGVGIIGENGIFFRSGPSLDNGGSPVFMAFNFAGALGFSGNIGSPGWNNIFKTPNASAYGIAGQTIISAGAFATTAWGVLGTVGGGTGVNIATTGLSLNSIVAGSPTGSNKGAGTVNATGLYVNGVSVASPLSATSASIGGAALLAGACATAATVTVTGATTTMVPKVSPQTYPGDGIFWDAYVSSVNTVTIKVCASVAATPTASIYNVRVIQ